MPQDLPKPYESPFPNPWVYHGVPKEDMYDLMQLYHHAFLSNPQTLAVALGKLTYPPESEIARTHPISQSTYANSAAMFFIVSDFIALKYARRHPNFKMRPIPQAVLNYLRPPFNQMTSLDIEDQRRFRASLPPEQQGEVYIDD
jgi:hypothetical protein